MGAWAPWGGRLVVRRIAGSVLCLLLVAVASAPRADAAPVAVPAPVPTSGSGLGWGSDQYGQLGPRVNGTVLTPVPVPLPAGTTEVALGRDFTLALAGGTIYSWGRNDRGQLGDGTHITRTHAAAISASGIAHVAADEQHAVAVTSAGQVLTWGANDFGELGDGTTTDRSTPTPVTMTAGVTSIGTGSDHALAVTTGGAVFAWGSDRSGQLGLGAVHAAPFLTPQAVHLPAGALVSEVAAGYRHSVALTRDHRVLTWGGNEHGQLGLNTITSSDARATVVPLPPGTSASGVAAGSVHTAALTADGGVLTWGANDHGQLGDGTTTERSSPVATHLPVGFAASKLSVGQSATVALAGDGSKLLTWGAGAFGQIGTGSRADASTPTAVPEAPSPVPTSKPRSFTAVAAGYYFDIAVAQQGPTASLLLSPASVTKAVGSAQAYTVEAYDAAGNDLGPRPAAGVTMTGGNCAGQTCTPNTPGQQTVTAGVDGVSGTAILLVVGGSVGPSPTGSSTATSSSTSSTATPSPTEPTPASASSLPATAAGSSGGFKGPGSMAFTGAVGVVLLAVLGLAAVAGGVILTTVARRRRSSEGKP